MAEQHSALLKVEVYNVQPLRFQRHEAEQIDAPPFLRPSDARNASDVVFKLRDRMRDIWFITTASFLLSASVDNDLAMATGKRSVHANIVLTESKLPIHILLQWVALCTASRQLRHTWAAASNPVSLGGTMAPVVASIPSPAAKVTIFEISS
ncbi:hypothetical protein GLOTRDRAFT_131656 [Gloeophyllum trabeum ATCC 11539]|uniref:Uncharacterized protein n=1 Tax=Gloeophyllum trabeum (strain ATCC 11539 / FP-39264 / Madison 617) TaxID=670483 RepID=S7PY16_GLOTA|nr:uncharacterized protein GLOTRDRAFT_131656 [Gloeophyllum trabeum ATCC 11539]EPQ52413.1 hypothetical protein GLOTRDRAFT_131656 [Gloeophyllum trabeum ATCC 11539]